MPHYRFNDTEKLFNVLKYIEQRDTKKISPRVLFMYKVLYTDWKQSDFSRNDLSIPGPINLIDNMLILKLPDNMNIIVGSLYLDGCSYLQKLPNKLYVAGNLYIRDTSIVKLPVDLQVEHQIYVDDDKIETIQKENPNFSQQIAGFRTGFVWNGY